jgi:hypothetical protein
LSLQFQAFSAAPDRSEVSGHKAEGMAKQTTITKQTKEKDGFSLVSLLWFV